MRIVAGVLALTTVGVTAGGCRRAAPEAEAVTGPPIVAVETARLQTLRAVVAGAGTVVPSTSGDWTIYPPESGRIESMPKAEGEQVKVGDVLVRFEFGNLSQEIATKELEVQVAVNRVEAAKAALTRVSGLFEKGYTPRNDFEAARNAVSQAESDLLRARQLLDASQHAAERATIKARFPGIVLKRFHMEGDLVNGAVTDPVMRVIDPSNLQVVMPVTLSEFSKLQLGQMATVASAVSLAGEPATIAFKAPVNDPLAATGDIRLNFTVPSTVPIDTPVQVEILLDQRSGVISVPTGALLKDGNATFVMLAGTDGRAHRREVRTGLVTSTRVEITAGLAVGDQFIIKNLENVVDGAEITADR